MDRLFINGTYAGRGHWINRRAEGEYTVEYSISGGGSQPREHKVTRVFLKPEGGVMYEEFSTLSFEPLESNRIKVTVGGAEGSASGEGYWFDRFCHYELEIKEGNRLEFTFVCTNVKIEGMGSATNHGNFTSWKESLSRVN